MNKTDLNKVTLEGISEKELIELKKIIVRFSKSYSKKAENITDKEWLKNELSIEMPHLEKTEIDCFCDDVFNSVEEFDSNLYSIKESEKEGVSKEVWLANKLCEASSNIPVSTFGEYLSSIDDTIRQGNAQMYRVITTTNGNINQNFNLDGFIAEQYHVNTFNMNAALENKSYRAFVNVPQNGETYAKNSVDVFIKDINKNEILHKYQFKFGKDAKSTINLLNHGIYNNQRLVVPKGQVSEVKSVFNTKSVTDYIGGTEKVPTTSNLLTKEEVKSLQNDVQQLNKTIEMSWNEYNTKQLAMNIGKQVSLAGIQAVAMESVFDIAYKVVNNESIEADEVIEKAIISGCDASVKAIAAGSLKVAVEKGMITIIPKGVGGNIFANIACFGIETVKIMSKVSEGKYTTTEALSEVGKMATSMFCGMSGALKGAEIGAIIGAVSFIPFGAVIGTTVGSVVGYIAGSKVGQGIHKAVKTVATGAKNMVSKAWESVKEVGSRATNFVKNTASKAWEGVKSFGRGVASIFGF